MNNVLTSIKAQEEVFLQELFEFLRIPSVSADKNFSNEVKLAADFVADKLRKAGADNVTLFPTPGYPVVYAEKIIDPNKPTILCYGHYDVQPPDPLDLWDSPPFEPVIKDGNIYARGSADDKGQMYMHIKAFEILMQLNALPCNIKFMIEGEEEIGSEHLESFVRAHRQLLQSDIVLVSDTSMIANDIPSITVGLRGLSYVEVEVTGPNRDLHSGVYGGAVANPINVLCKMIAQLHDEKGRITIPGFYDDVEELSAAERAEMAQAPFDQKAYNADLGIRKEWGEEGYTTLERVSIRPTLDVNGIWGGYTGQGAKTVLPSKAYAKISMRLVPHQQHEKITRLFAEYFKSLAPDSVQVKVTPMHGGQPAVTPTNSIAYKAAALAVESTYGKKPIPLRTGGSIPVVAMLEEVLGIKSVLLGFGLDSDAIHSPNEHFGVWNFFKGIETVACFLQNFSAMYQKTNS
ncbi:MAG: dipeptidase [Chitinophagales bacterium]|nr:dipeptidase [Chitinophagales bacterium]MDW8274110.1 dipeptidase [Chitinophagales bacterium]